jgi:hypothetical protein
MGLDGGGRRGLGERGEDDPSDARQESQDRHVTLLGPLPRRRSIRAFSSTRQRRRRATPVITATRRNVSLPLANYRANDPCRGLRSKTPIIGPSPSAARSGRRDAYTRPAGFDKFADVRLRYFARLRRR